MHKIRLQVDALFRLFLFVSQLVVFSQWSLAAPLRSLVLGDGGSAAVTAVRLAIEEKERGITINTSHVEYRSANRTTLGLLVEDVVQGEDFDSAIVTLQVSAGPRDESVESILDTGHDLMVLCRLLNMPHVFLLVDPVLGSPEVIEQLRAMAIRLGYLDHNFGLFLGSVSAQRRDNDTWAAELLDRVLASPGPDPDVRAPLLMAVADVQSSPRGTVATGRIETGIVQVGDAVEVVGYGFQPIKSTVTGIEMFRKILDRGEAGDQVGLLLRGIDKKDIRRGMVITKPGSIAPHSTFRAVTVRFAAEKPGRRTPFHNGRYLAAVQIRTAEVPAAILEQVSPDGILTTTVELIAPIAMDKGLRFAIREGGRTVGAGQVIEIVK